MPAGGSTEVTVTADADDAAGVGRYTGFVVATDAAGAVRARTAVGLVKEEERWAWTSGPSIATARQRAAR